MHRSATASRLSTRPRRWTTAGIPESEQFGFWQAVVWEAFVPASPARRDTGPFISSVESRSVGPLGVSRIVSQPQSVLRTPSQVHRQPGDVFFLNLPLTEGTSARQDGRTALLGPGDFTIVDSSRPFELDFGRCFEQVSLTVPHEVLAPLLAHPGDVTAVRVAGDEGVGAIASSALRALATTTGPVDRTAARSLTTHVAGLVALALGGARDAAAIVATPVLILQAALDEIERSLGDPGLSPAVVAERVGISTRYLHRLFSARGPSFGRWLLARRLERCRQDLRDPGRAHWTITQIAHENGFADSSYFARAFRSQYGATPRELRAREAARGTSAPTTDRARQPICSASSTMIPSGPPACAAASLG